MGSLVAVSGWGYTAARIESLRSQIVVKGQSLDLRDADEGTSISAAALLPRLPKEPTILLGWSLGGQLCLELARLSKMVVGLILIGSTAKFCRTSGYRFGMPESVLTTMLARFSETPATVFEEFSETAAAGIRDSLPFGSVSEKKLLESGLQYLRDTDLREELSAITVPVLIIHGSEDRIVPMTAGQFLAENLSSSTYTPLSGCGHMVWSGCEEDVAERCRNFVYSIPCFTECRA